MLLGHEEILDRKAVAAGALEADDMPDSGHLGIFFWEQHCPDDRAAIGVEARRPVALDDWDMATEPGGIVAATGKAPARRHTVAAVDDPLGAGSRTPGEDAARSAKDL